jgi:AraC family transcriptional regulator
VAVCVRETTATSRREMVAHVVDVMRERLGETLSLDDLARQAFLSPYHFHRVFRAATGVPPGRFLAALRMERAKVLLLETELRVTDICLEVGYRSLGTFTTHFRDLVGVAPSRFRRLAGVHGGVPVASLAFGQPGAPEDGLRVVVSAGDGFSGTVFVGTFPTPLPQAQPLECAIDLLPATLRVRRTPAVVLATAFASGSSVRDALLVDGSGPRVGSVPIRSSTRTLELRLRTLGELDPPVVLALPLLAAAALNLRRAAA